MPPSNRTFDAENRVEQRGGYPDLAAWIARDPDSESFIFRKFTNLGARNLLSLQSNLIDLERRIHSLDDEMRQSKDMDTALSLRRWETFQTHAEDQSRLEHRKLMLETELAIKIKQYHEALVLQSQICELRHPSSRVLNTFRSFFQNPKPIVLGRAKYLLDDQRDLVALRPPQDPDLLSRFLRDHWPFPGSQDAPSMNNTEYFRESSVKIVVAIINIFVAAVLLVAPIISLYFISRQGAKLGMIAGFTVLFSLGVGVLTSAKRQEIFAAGAAYAAVLVVFVSGNLKDG